MFIAAKKKITSSSFDNKLLLFAKGEALPFAYRSPEPELSSYSFTNERLIERIGEFEISHADNKLICRYIGNPSGFALIVSLEESETAFDKADVVSGYLRAAYALDLSSRCIEAFEDIIFRLAEKCGCLSDIYREDTGIDRPIGIVKGKPDSAFIAVSLPIIALMFRRISALRGFNFKITFCMGLPCLVFSAKVILRDNEGIKDIPEHRHLCEISQSGEISYVYRLNDIGEDCSSGRLFRLSLAICPQTADPTGVLRAPEWKAHTENILSKIDLDVPGRF
jgi:hypothetical protein